MYVLHLIFGISLPLVSATEFYLLPAGADYNHPALNSTLLIEMLSHGVDPAQLPRLPAHIVNNMQTLSKRSLVAEDRICTTTSGSPWERDVSTLAAVLRTIGDKHCCQIHGDGRRGCTKVLEVGSAQATLCGDQGFCLRCRDLGESVKAVAQECKRVERAGGVLR
jgi:hypothetical protein